MKRDWPFTANVGTLGFALGVFMESANHGEDLFIAGVAVLVSIFGLIVYRHHP